MRVYDSTGTQIWESRECGYSDVPRYNESYERITFVDFDLASDEKLFGISADFYTSEGPDFLYNFHFVKGKPE